MEVALKRLLPLLGVLAALALIPTLSWAAADIPANAFVLADDEQAAAHAMQEAGGQAFHIFTRAIIGYLPTTANLVGMGTVREVHRTAVDLRAARAFGPAAEAAAVAWNQNVCGLRPAAPPAVCQRGRRLVGDTINLPRSRALMPSLARLLPTGAGRYNTSEYMVGSVAVGIIVPESSGNAENWSTERLNTVVAETQAGIDWWRQREPSANLTFSYDLHLSVPVSIEPIATEAVGSAATIEDAPMGQWMNECFAYLGYPADVMFEENAYSYANDLRLAKGTNWAFIVFVVDSLNDADGAFPDGLFAFARPGGPYLVMTYDNDGWGIENMDSTVAHEMGHIFYALDEYRDAGNLASDRSGYFNEINGNNEGDGLTNVSCIMRGDEDSYDLRAVCGYTKRQMGQRDQDRNGIQDVLDVPPVCTLPAFTPDPTGHSLLTYLGRAQVGTLPNLNTCRPELPHPAISVSTIAGVEWQVDSTDWTPATPATGAYDSGQESFRLIAGPLDLGEHTVRARAVDNQGKVGTPASDTVTIIAVPRVVSCFPAPGATNAARNTVVRATFSEPIVAGSITSANFTLQGQYTGVVAATVSYDAATMTATLQPATLLAVDKYTATVRGGAAGPVSPDGRHVEDDWSWSFTVPEDTAPPTITITTPQAGAVVRGLVPVQAAVEDETGVARVDVFVDGVNLAVLTAPPYTLTWDTSPQTVTDGPHQIMVWAWDTAGRRAQASISVVADNASFDDVPKGSAIWRYVESVAREGITGGCSLTPPLYCPDRAVTRGQMAVFLCRAAGIAPYGNPTPTFEDVPRTHPMYPYIEAAFRNGLVSGCSTTPRLFCPNTAVTRGQLAVMLCRAAEIAPYDNPTPTFSDVPRGSSQYPYVEALYRATVTGGIARDPLRYGPALPVTRGQMAVFLCRAFNLSLE